MVVCPCGIPNSVLYMPMYLSCTDQKNHYVHLALKYCNILLMLLFMDNYFTCEHT